MSEIRRSPSVLTRNDGKTAMAEQQRRHREHREKARSGEPGRLDDPQWVIVGCAVDAGVRLYASRDVDAVFRLVKAGEFSQECDWHIDATMRDMLVVTRPSYPEALAELQKLWAARDAAVAQQAVIERARTARKAIGR